MPSGFGESDILVPMPPMHRFFVPGCGGHQKVRRDDVPSHRPTSRPTLASASGAAITIIDSLLPQKSVLPVRCVGQRAVVRQNARSPTLVGCDTQNLGGVEIQKDNRAGAGRLRKKWPHPITSSSKRFAIVEEKLCSVAIEIRRWRRSVRSDSMLDDDAVHRDPLGA